MILCLLYSWARIYLNTSVIIPIIVNKGFITGMVAGLAFLINNWLLGKEKKDESHSKGLSLADLKQMTLYMGLITIYFGMVLEIWYQFSTRVPNAPLYAIYIQLFSFAYAIKLLWFRRKSETKQVLRIVLTLLCLSLFITNINTNFEVSQYLRETGPVHFIWAHWVGVVLLGWLLIQFLRSFYHLETGNWSAYRVPFAWIGVAGLLILLSVEMHQLMYWFTNNNIDAWSWWQNLYWKAGLTILWGICSFILMWVGMQGRNRTYRIISLTLFTITLLKLFLYDIKRIPPGGKIAAFILLGVLLLTVSFMYQRLKKMIIDNQS